MRSAIQDLQVDISKSFFSSIKPFNLQHLISNSPYWLPNHFYPLIFIFIYPHNWTGN